MPDIVARGIDDQAHTTGRGEGEAAGEIWRQTNDMPSLIFTGRYDTPIDPRTLSTWKFTARCEAAGVRRLTVHDAGTLVPRRSLTSTCIRTRSCESCGMQTRRP
jgi:hypothetical protein